MDFAAAFDSGLPYREFLDKYATPDQRQRWEAFRAGVVLTATQQELLASFARETKVLVLAGTWCGDCVNQCPIFEQFESASRKILVRYLDRDDAPQVANALKTCGGARVPAVVFLSEDGEFCGRYGDRTLARYRMMVGRLQGASCPTGLGPADDTTSLVVQEWLDQFERIQWMLRTSTRLRQLHGD
ncbi:MAG: thioredoxin family protein [Planctomycetaceae bacterium]|nr:thioredoxin family protein [Planctomycetaceae bacterium]